MGEVPCHLAEGSFRAFSELVRWVGAGELVRGAQADAVELQSGDAGRQSTGPTQLAVATQDSRQL